MQSEKEKWYALQVENGREKESIILCRKILKSEKESDRKFFVPEYDRRIKSRGNWNTVRKVLFPGYIFASVEDAEVFFIELKKIPAFVKLLGYEFEFVPLAERETKFIKDITDDNMVAGVSVGYIEGDRVIVESGPMIGMEGLIRHIDRHKRLAEMEMELMGRKLMVKMGLEIVRKA